MPCGYDRSFPSCLALIILSGALLLGGLSALLGQAPVTIDGHVFHAEGHSPCGDALIQAWPCGSTFTADLDGRVEAFCPEGIDSVTVLVHGHAVVTAVVDDRDHLDIALESLAVSLRDAFVRAESSEDVPEGEPVRDQGDLMTTLDRVAGIRSLDLGAGLVQPVLRGLVGSRVAVLEDGIPLI